MARDDDYVEELRVVRRKKDTYRSNSSKSNEFESDLLRDKHTKNVAGPTESRPVDEDELREKYQGDPIFVTSPSASTAKRDLTPGEQALADAFVELGSIVIRDLVVPLVRDVGVPTVKAKLSALVDRRRVRALERAEAKERAIEATAQARELDTTRAPETAELATIEPSISMSKSDLLLARLQLHLAEEYAARQRWLVAHADVSNEDLSPELEESIARVLEGRSEELDDEQREVVAAFLHRAGQSATRKVLHHDPHTDG